MVAAVDSYDPESGAFSTWFMYHLKNAFAEATGYRTKSVKNEPLNNSVSLDTPLNDDFDSDTMMEVVEDPNGQKPTQGVEDAIFHQQLHEAIEKALATLPEQSAEIAAAELPGLDPRRRWRTQGNHSGTSSADGKQGPSAATETEHCLSPPPLL